MRSIALLFLACAAPLCAGRITISLDGTWNIEDSLDADAVPKAFTHTVPVPGMANLASPEFPDVDRFDSREIISNRVRQGKLPASAIVTSVGIPRQNRNYFWYERTFRVPAKKEVAILKINKAQFGTKVWLNGREIGEHLSCFTAGYFNVTAAMNWSGENRLIVRIGAHPAVLPEWMPAGTDFEKNKWTPGIYDDVSLLVSDNPVIETVQVAPRIAASEIVVETKAVNYAGTPRSVEIAHRVKTWKDGRPVSAPAPERVNLKAGERRTWRHTIAIPGARLWSPEDPFLYVLETSTGGDSASTRFGMREFRFDTATRRAWLNGRVYFLRGSNITLHRFFEDPKCKRLPWTEAWVRKLLGEIPKKMHWNSFRFCIGPAPEKWFDIADETGLLIQNEYFIWTGHPDWRGMYSRRWKADVLIEEYARWMRDHWNHPSAAVWDANNESFDNIFADSVIPAVRGLDLSGRPWENSYNVAAGPDDPVEEHPYLFSRGWSGGAPFHMRELEHMTGMRPGGDNTPSGHAAVVNEYGWLWLNRDGTPTELTAKVYENLVGKDASAEQRFATYGYLLGGLTEFWRAFRHYAGVLHFVYLTCSYPGVYTSDHFRDVEKLELDPYFADYMGQAFRPLGVYIHFWQPRIKPEARQFSVMMVNDEPREASGKLVLSLETESGSEVVRAERAFSIPSSGQMTYLLSLPVLKVSGPHLLKATATPAGGTPTVSRRKVTVDRGL